MTNRIFNITEACTILAIDRNTMNKWIADGLPTIDRSRVDARSPVGIDLALLMRWRNDRVVSETLETLGLGAGGEQAMTDKQAKVRKLVADAIAAEIKVDLELGKVCRWEEVIDRVTILFSEIRNALQGVGSKAAGHAAMMDDAPSIQELIDRNIAEALESLDVDALLDR